MRTVSAPGPTDEHSEAELIERARSDPHAFGRLYEAHYSRILNYIFHRTLDVSVAEDLTSNTFFKALRALPAYRHRAPFRAWLYRIATNEIRMHWRSQRKRQALQEDAGREADLQRVRFSPSAAETEEQRREQMRRYARVRECLEGLPERYRVVLVLRYFEGLQIDEIAHVLGKRAGTVKSLIHRGLKRLRRSMGGKSATFS